MNVFRSYILSRAKQIIKLLDAHISMWIWLSDEIEFDDFSGPITQYIDFSGNDFDVQYLYVKVSTIQRLIGGDAREREPIKSYSCSYHHHILIHEKRIYILWTSVMEMLESNFSELNNIFAYSIPWCIRKATGDCIHPFRYGTFTEDNSRSFLFISFYSSEIKWGKYKLRLFDSIWNGANANGYYSRIIRTFSIYIYIKKTLIDAWLCCFFFYQSESKKNLSNSNAQNSR